MRQLLALIAFALTACASTGDREPIAQSLPDREEAIRRFEQLRDGERL